MIIFLVYLFTDFGGTVVIFVYLFTDFGGTVVILFIYLLTS